MDSNGWLNKWKQGIPLLKSMSVHVNLLQAGKDVSIKNIIKIRVEKLI